MADHTKIQWCDSTVNPIMGCGGCELFPKPNEVLHELDRQLEWSQGKARSIYRELIKERWDELIAEVGEPNAAHLKKVTTTNIWHLRGHFAARVAHKFGGKYRKSALAAVESQITCYAAKLHLNRGFSITNPTRKVNKGYAPTFEDLTQFPGRVSDVAKKKDLLGTKRRATDSGTGTNKPWLDGLPRLIFVSDMGDALTRKSDFKFLLDELASTQFPNGLCHLWLWLTKRPDYMREFAEQLNPPGFPENFCAMTTVTDQDTLFRVDQLRQVKAPCRALSLEPLWSNVTDELDLEGIDWVIVGGESGKASVVRPFHVEWVLELKDKCKDANVALFVKQLGRKPLRNGKPVQLNDEHGGDWDEWDEDLRVRELPDYFHQYRQS